MEQSKKIVEKAQTIKMISLARISRRLNCESHID